MTQELTGYPSIDKPWLKYYSDEAINAEIPRKSIYEYVYEANQDNRDSVAINYYDYEITYGELFDSVSRVTFALELLGVGKGDIVTICAVNSPEVIELIFALNRISAVANLIYGTSNEKEIITYLNNTNAEFVFVLDIFQDKFTDIRTKTDVKHIVVFGSLPVANGFTSWKEFMRDAELSATFIKEPDITAIITYTGGTTGGSKGVMQSNYGIISNVWQYEKRDVVLKRDSKWLLCFPLFIGFGIFSLLIPMRCGMTLIIRNPLEESLSDLYTLYKPNYIINGPAWWEAFADDDKEMDLSMLFEPMTGGDTLKLKVEEKINKYLSKNSCDYKIINGYGMSECGPGISFQNKNAYKYGSIGIPFVKVIVAAFDTETGNELKYDETGELCINTPSMMQGYLNNEDETLNVIRKHKDGKRWVHTGDLGYVTKDGFIYIVGRIKRYMLYITSKGVMKKVFSMDIEKVIDRFTGVEKTAVVSRNDSIRNQVPIAFVILKENEDKAAVIENIRKYADENLDEEYRPIDYIVVDEFPLTKVGKVDYIELEKRANIQGVEL